MDVFNFNDIDINKIPASCKIKYDDYSFGLSKWVSPKRTRSYPYERVYNTLGISKRITVIPIIKDEGKNGDRDFIQWDTVSLMNLLDVYIIFAYYYIAEKHKKIKDKITKQKFENKLIKNKIIEIKNYHSSALHWNIKEIEKSFPMLIQKVKTCYRNIGNIHNIVFHSEQGIDKFADLFISNSKTFLYASRQKAKEAQEREMRTIQPKEALSTLSKAKMTIENYLGGKYYFTTDEVKIENDKVFLIECKHSRNSLLPTSSDIKDGLLKMILYTNLKDVYINEKEYKPIPVVRLTSTRLKMRISSEDSCNKIKNDLSKNGFSKNQEKMIENLLKEAIENNFILILEKAN